MVVTNTFGGGEVECPHCQVGLMQLEPNFKYEDIYDCYTCPICEGELIDWESINYHEV